MSKFLLRLFACFVCVVASFETEKAFAQPERQAGLLLDEAIAARNRGEFHRAEDLLVDAYAISPKNVDILLVLGLTRVALDKPEQATSILEEARTLAPQYADVRMALARLYARQGNIEAAIAEADAAIAADPDYGEAQLVRAGLALRQSNPGLAAEHYKRAAELSPDDYRAWLGQGDAAWRQENWPLANQYYTKAADMAPDNEDVAARLKRQAPVHSKWRVDLDYGHSDLSRNLPSWQETILQISHTAESNTRVFGRVDYNDRSFATDTLVEIGLEVDVSARVSLSMSAAVTPNADFRQKWSAQIGTRIKLREGNKKIGPTIALIDAKVSEYATGHVSSLNVGLEQYCCSGRFWLTATSINVRDENGNLNHGGMGRVNLAFAERGFVFLGYAQAPETETNVTRDTRSYFAGVSFPVTSTIDARVSFSHNKRENSYTRDRLGVGVSVRF